MSSFFTKFYFVVKYEIASGSERALAKTRSVTANDCKECGSHRVKFLIRGTYSLETPLKAKIKNKSKGKVKDVIPDQVRNDKEKGKKRDSSVTNVSFRMTTPLFLSLRESETNVAVP